jgi:hypothetical protein
MSARASAIAVPVSPATDDVSTFYLATWTGGVFKTTNNGVTFKPVFDGQNKVTIGAIAVAPSNPKIVWVGTGDTRGARSSYPGDGVYMSADAGETRTNMGLRETHHVSRVVIHPANPNFVTPNEPSGMVIQYYLKTARTDPATIVITDVLGTEVARLKGEAAAGINTAVWNMRRAGPAVGGRAGGGRGTSVDQLVPLGAYVVTLEIGGRKLTQPAHITRTQGWSVGTSFPSVIRNQP